MAPDTDSLLFTATPITITQCLNSARDCFERTKLSSKSYVPSEFKQPMNPIFSGSPLEVASYLNIISSTLYTYEFVQYRMKNSKKVSKRSENRSQCDSSVVYSCFCKSVDNRLPTFETFGSTEEVALNACCAQMLYLFSPKPHLAALLLERFKRSRNNNSSFVLFSKPVPCPTKAYDHNLENNYNDNNNTRVDVDYEQLLKNSAAERGILESKSILNDDSVCETSKSVPIVSEVAKPSEKSDYNAMSPLNCNRTRNLSNGSVFCNKENGVARDDSTGSFPVCLASNEGTFSALQSYSNKFSLNKDHTQRFIDENGRNATKSQRSPSFSWNPNLDASDVSYSCLDIDRIYNINIDERQRDSNNYGFYSTSSDNRTLKRKASPIMLSHLSRKARRRLIRQESEPPKKAKEVENETIDDSKDLDKLRKLIAENQPLCPILKKRFASIVTKANNFNDPSMREFRLSDSVTVEKFLSSKQPMPTYPTVKVSSDRWDRLKHFPDIVPNQVVQVMDLKTKCGKFSCVDYGSSIKTLLPHYRSQCGTKQQGSKDRTTNFVAHASTKDLAVQACYAQAIKHFLNDRELALRKLNNFIRRDQDKYCLVLYKDPEESVDVQFVDDTEELKLKLEELKEEKQKLFECLPKESDLQSFELELNLNDDKLADLIKHPRVDSIETKCRLAVDNKERFEVTLDVNDRYLFCEISSVSFTRAFEGAFNKALELMNTIKDRGDESLIPSNMVNDHRLLVSLVELKTGLSIIDHIPMIYKYDCDSYSWKAKMTIEGKMYNSKSNFCQSQKEALND